MMMKQPESYSLYVCENTLEPVALRNQRYSNKNYVNC